MYVYIYIYIYINVCMYIISCTNLVYNKYTNLI